MATDRKFLKDLPEVLSDTYDVLNNDILDQQSKESEVRKGRIPIKTRDAFNLKQKKKKVIHIKRKAIPTQEDLDNCQNQLLTDPDEVENINNTFPSIVPMSKKPEPFISFAERKYQKSPKHAMTDVRPPTGLEINPNIKQFLNIQFDSVKRPIQRTVIGSNLEYAGAKYKSNLKKVKHGETVVTQRRIGSIIVPNLQNNLQFQHALTTSNPHSKRPSMGKKTSSLLAGSLQVIPGSNMTSQLKISNRKLETTPEHTSDTSEYSQSSPNTTVEKTREQTKLSHLQLPTSQTNIYKLDNSTRKSNHSFHIPYMVNSNPSRMFQKDKEIVKTQKRAEKAMIRHNINLTQWDSTIQRFQEIRKSKYKKLSPNLQSFRSLVEMQQMHEGSVLSELEQQTLQNGKCYNDLQNTQIIRMNQTPGLTFDTQSIQTLPNIQEHEENKIIIEGIPNETQMSNAMLNQSFANLTELDRSNLKNQSFMTSQVSRTEIGMDKLSQISHNRHNKVNIAKKGNACKPLYIRQDWKEERDKYISSLNGADMKGYQTQSNSFNALWSTEPVRRVERQFKAGYLSMTKRSGFNISIDKPMNPLTPKCVANDVVDPLRNSLIKLSNKAKFVNLTQLNSPHHSRNLHRKEEEAKYFQTQFSNIFGSNQRNFKIKNAKMMQSLSPTVVGMLNQGSSMDINGSLSLVDSTRQIVHGQQSPYNFDDKSGTITNTKDYRSTQKL